MFKCIFILLYDHSSNFIFNGCLCFLEHSTGMLPWLKLIFQVSSLASELSCSWTAYHSSKPQHWLQVGPGSYCRLCIAPQEQFPTNCSHTMQIIRPWLRVIFPTYQHSQLQKKKKKKIPQHEQLSRGIL